MNNLLVRSLSGLVFLAIMIGGLLLHPLLFAVLFLLIMTGMLLEFYRMTLGRRYPAARWLALLTAVLFFAAMFFHAWKGLSLNWAFVAMLPLYAAMAQSLFVKDRSHLAEFSHLFTGLVYIAVPISLGSLLVLRDGVFDGRLMLAFFILIWASDVGAYGIGMLLGRNGPRLCPSISPKKSWAGFWGSIAAVIAAALILRSFGFFAFPWYHAVGLAVVMNLAGTFGDLFESTWKRHYGLKDSGTIIPGHGGLLDRFDSSLFAIPAGSIYLILAGLL